MYLFLTGIVSRVAFFAIFATLIASPAWASGGSLPTLVEDIGVSLLVAGVLAVIFARLKIPSIAAFILAGIIVGPQVLHQVTDPANIEAIAQIGFILLLFVIGLEINVRKLVMGSKSILLAGLIQYPATLLFGFLIAHGLILIGLGGMFEGLPLAPLYIGVAIAGSSSLLVVKLFQEHFELDTYPGRIALTMLIFQDIWAIILTIIQPSLANPDLTAILFSFLGIGILIGITAVLARTLVTIAFTWIAKVPELILLGAVAWCFTVVAFGTNIDNATGLLGFNWHMSVGAGMGALIAGATIASSPFSTEIVTKVGLVKDFFVTLFFVGLGISMPAIDGWAVPMLGVFVAIIAVASRQLVFFPLFCALRVDQRSAQVTSVRLAQISEFALVIAFLGLEMGHISHELSSVIILAFIFTAILTTPLFEKAYAIHSRLRPFLTAIGFKEPVADEDDEHDDAVLAILGVHRDASSFLHELSMDRPDLLPKTTVVDFNVSLHPKIRELGVHVEYGDIANEETLIHAGVDRSKIIICTISDDLLRGMTNQNLVKTLRRMNPEAIIISNAIDMQSSEEVKKAGADYVYMSRIEVASALMETVSHALGGTMSDHCDIQEQRTGDLLNRNEVIR